VRNVEPSGDLWELAISRNTAQVSFIASYDDPPHLPEDSVPTSKLFEFLKEKNKFVESTNFTERELLSFFQDSQPKFAQLRSRGANPAIDGLDSIILLLHWLKTGLDFKTIAANSGYGETATRSAIMRAKDALFGLLIEKWWAEPLVRPVPLEGTAYPFIGLVCDSTSTEVFRPAGRFEEAKVYWDGKNKIYALKKEVAVLACSPHYAIFSGPAFVGSEHDYSFFKKGFQKYKDYLTKTPQEKHQMARDLSEHSWAIFCDSGYRKPG